MKEKFGKKNIFGNFLIIPFKGGQLNTGVGFILLLGENQINSKNNCIHKKTTLRYISPKKSKIFVDTLTFAVFAKWNVVKLYNEDEQTADEMKNR